MLFGFLFGVGSLCSFALLRRNGTLGRIGLLRARGALSPFGLIPNCGPLVSRGMPDLRRANSTRASLRLSARLGFLVC